MDSRNDLIDGNRVHARVVDARRKPVVVDVHARAAGEPCGDRLVACRPLPPASHARARAHPRKARTRAAPGWAPAEPSTKARRMRPPTAPRQADGTTARHEGTGCVAHGA